MQSRLLQDWITIKMKDGLSGVTQSAHEYFDLGQHEDLVMYLDVREVTGNPSIVYETAPTRQDSLFLAMVAPIGLTAFGLRVDRVMFCTAAIPPARYVRWRFPSGSAFSVTFRLWATAYKYC